MGLFPLRQTPESFSFLGDSVGEAGVSNPLHPNMKSNSDLPRHPGTRFELPKCGCSIIKGKEMGGQWAGGGVPPGEQEDRAAPTPSVCT